MIAESSSELYDQPVLEPSEKTKAPGFIKSSYEGHSLISGRFASKYLALVVQYPLEGISCIRYVHGA